MRWVSCAILAVLAAASAPARADEINLVAVVELEKQSARVSDTEVQFLTDTVRKAAADGLDPARFKVLTRESMEVLLPASKVTCLAGKCLAEIGRTLQARYVVGGNVKDVGSKIGVTLEMYDSGSGALLGSEQGRADSVDDAVTWAQQTAPRLVQRVSGATAAVTGGGKVEHGVALDRGERIVNQQTDQTGYLVIKSDPPAAAITLNGKEVGRAPLQLDQMVGRYVIVGDLGKLYHAAREAVDLTTTGAKVTLVLKQAFGSLEVRSSPAGADVWLDGVVAGRTPYVNRQQPSGTYAVRVELANHVPATMDVVVADGQSVLKEVPLSADYGSLTVTSEPSGASIAMDDVATGRTTPATFPIVRPGVHVLKLTLAAHGDVTERATVKRGEAAKAAVALTPRLGLLKVTASYDDATPCEGDLAVDGRGVGSTPWKGEVLAARHDVSVNCGGGVAAQSVTIEHNQTQVVALLVPGNAPGAAVVPRPVSAATVSHPAEREAEEERAVTVPLSLSLLEGFAYYGGKAQRTNVGLEAGLALRFRDATWIRPGLGLGWTVESPVNFTLRPGIQWFLGPVFFRTALAVMVTPGVAAGFVGGFGGDIPLWKGGFLTLEAAATVWSKTVVPVDFRLGVGHAF